MKRKFTLKNTKKPKNLHWVGGGVSSLNWGSLPPRGAVKYHWYCIAWASVYISYEMKSQCLHNLGLRVTNSHSSNRSVLQEEVNLCPWHPCLVYSWGGVSHVKHWCSVCVIIWEHNWSTDLNNWSVEGCKSWHTVDSVINHFCPLRNI